MLPVPWRLPVPLHRVGLLFSITATNGWAVSVVISLATLTALAFPWWGKVPGSLCPGTLRLDSSSFPYSSCR